MGGFLILAVVTAVTPRHRRGVRNLVAALKDQGAINGVDVKRVVFNEVTKKATT